MDVVLGPHSLSAVDSALDTLMPWLLESKYQIRPDGSLEFAHNEPREAIELLRDAIEQFLPSEMLEHCSVGSVGRFFDHVDLVAPSTKACWFSTRFRKPRTTYDVELKLHWNQGREMPIDF